MQEASILVEFPFEQRLQFMNGVSGIPSFGKDNQFAARTGREHHQTHNALAVDSFAVLFDKNLAIKAVGSADEHGGGTSVDAQFVDHHQLLWDLDIFIWYFAGAAHLLDSIPVGGAVANC